MFLGNNGIIPKIAFSVIINEHDDANYGVGGETLDKVRNQ
jgi:phenylpyruvate tautomerase PptA (4-oxalocrotonate tautomerase family)